MPDLVTIASGELTARINPLGAELWSLTDRLGREYMTDADPAYWRGHAPLLFPIVGALVEDRYRHQGTEYEMEKHGFARRSTFEVVETGEGYAAFRLTDNEATRAIYPFAFQLDMAFRIDDAHLKMEARITNTGNEPLLFSFGFHPAFAWPLPGGGSKADHFIAFELPEPQPIRRIVPASGLVLPEPVATPVEGHLFCPDTVHFEADAVIWDHLSSRALTFGTPGGGQLSIAFPDTPMLGIWQKPGASYLCIEPWHGHADPLGFTGEFRDKPGVIALPSGEERVFRMDVAILSAD